MGSNFDKSLQEKLRVEEELPSGLSWDALGDAITSQVEKENSREQLIKANKMYKRIIIGIAVVMVSSLCLYIANFALKSNGEKYVSVNQLDKDEKVSRISESLINKASQSIYSEKIEVKNNQNTVNQLSNTKPNSKSINHQFLGQDVQNNFNPNTKEENENTRHLKSVKDGHQMTSESAHSSIKEDLTSKQVNIIKEDSDIYSKNNSSEKILNKKAKVTHQSSSVNSADNQNLSQKNAGSGINVSMSNLAENEIYMSGPIALLPYSSQKLENVSLFPHLLPTVSPSQPIDLKTNVNPWYIESGTGINIASANFKDHKSRIGISSVFLLSRRIGRINVSSGLEYNLIHDRFNKSAKIREFSIVKPNELTKLQVNLISKDTVKIYGDTIVNAREIRQVIHNNYYHRIAIPLFTSMDFRLKKMNINVGLGVSAYKFIQQTGRFWDGSQFIDISTSSPFLDNRWKIDYIAQMSLTYPVSNSIDLGIRLAANLRPQNLSTSNDVKSTWTWQQLQIMTRKKF